MTGRPDAPAPGAQDAPDRDAARRDAAVEVGKAIALGAVPFLAQAIDACDTIASAIALHRAPPGEASDAARFDFVLALAGWVPGPGDGVKKSLRIVERDPQRYAPVLFDLLRSVLRECGIDTSPEALLDAVFDPGYLQAQLGEITQGVLSSDGFEALPPAVQRIVRDTLAATGRDLPALLGVAHRRIGAWKKQQRDSSASVPPHGRSAGPPPRASDRGTASEGAGRGGHVEAGTAAHGTVATQALHRIGREAIGISGEHIADYLCAYDARFGWGAAWQGHDDGGQGRWADGPPSATRPGKLSKGGDPKQPHVLYRLHDGPNGAGIDAVWRANERGNGGKPYAIVEAKASRDEDGPKFLRRPGNTRQPGVAGTLRDNAVRDASELLEPLEDAGSPAPSRSASRTAGPKKGKAGADAGPSRKSSPPDAHAPQRVRISRFR